MEETITLGALIDALKNANPDADVCYDFAYFTPTDLDSYRGYYEQLALGYGRDPITAKKLLQVCEQADGETFQGWKGGDFKMSRSTPVWVSNSGEAASTAIVGVLITDHQVVLQTAYLD